MGEALQKSTVEDSMNTQEFSERVTALEPRLYRVATAILGSGPDREDACQSALFKAWQKLPQLRQPRFFETWLTRILINECKSALRSRRTAPAQQPPAQESPANEALRDALFTLESELRLLLTLRHVEGYTVREIARMLHMSEYSVKGKLQRGRRKLKDALYEQEERR